MTSTRKTLMIAGALLVAAAGTGYVMLLRADHRAIEEAGIGDSAAPAAAAPANDDHTAQGAIAPPRAGATQQPAAPAAASVAPASAVVGHIASDKPQPSATPVVRPTVKVVTVDAQDSTPAAPKPAVPAAPAPAVQQAQSTPPTPQPTQHASRRREGLERHAAANPPSAIQKSETPETAALVRESAKLDPSLPPPPMSAYAGAGTGAGAGAGTYRQGSSSGANPVAAAMTEQLVRESSSIKSQTPANGGPTTAK
ncbi:extensin [Burkholderia pseudomultivorans]|uniref:Extensin n=1 Tax=Burkholderia pseudomultivorans TaxID=1207504 RepID=A0ABU2DZ84_9BURK|nr:extensin [Burkholderia pseudomultivorans]MDR8729270.1 hypothetical protein [Burkholderia pseudomultivorans]MDR8732619.1 hypothetical protein [Burkholderia pseudomultivorans]MDR8739485.1 hypothetical protein [Burkholderia pseudomultivorans]MDR8752897.1 hypothetical protein [Burkholderia pseudomultivorans]MDR8778184.1 hypothetical protein [Burkholderia pseudomultivorans]